MWNDAQHWRDRDGQKPPAQLLVVGVDAILQRWRGAAAGHPRQAAARSRRPQRRHPGRRMGDRHRWAKAPAVGGHGRRLLHRSAHGRFLHLRVLDDRRPHRRRPSQGVGRRHANAARRPRLAGDHARRAADEDEIRRQKPAAFRDRRLERGWRPVLGEEAPKAALPPASEPEAEPARPRRPRPQPAMARRKTPTLERMADVRPVSPGETINDKIPW